MRWILYKICKLTDLICTTLLCEVRGQIFLHVVGNYLSVKTEPTYPLRGHNLRAAIFTPEIHIFPRFTPLPFHAFNFSPRRATNKMFDLKLFPSSSSCQTHSTLANFMNKALLK